MNENQIATKIVGAAIEVHRQLGPGLLESTYETCLCYELKELGLSLSRQQALPVIYKGIKLDAGYRIDLLIEDKVIVELKCIDEIVDIHTAQLLTYLKLKKLKLSLLINFNTVLVKNGIKRILSGYSSLGSKEILRELCTSVVKIISTICNKHRIFDTKYNEISNQLNIL